MHNNQIKDVARIVHKYCKDNNIESIGDLYWDAIAQEVDNLSKPRVVLISNGVETEFFAGSCSLNQAMISLIKHGERFEVLPLL